MHDRVPFRSPQAERHIFVRRLVLAGGLVLSLSLVLTVRYFSLQILNYENYQTQSDRNRVHLQPIAPTRGLVYDRNGVLLADNRPSYTLLVTKERVVDLDASMDLVQQLLHVEPGDVEKFEERLAVRRRSFEQVPLKFHLSHKEIANLAVNRHRLPGFEVKAELARHYPYGPYFSHLLGYVARISEKELKALDPANYAATHLIGKTGIEKRYEDILHGRAGYEHVETDARGRVLRSLDRTDPQPGKDLILNIDARIQKIAHDALGSMRGAVVAIDPRDGGVVAFVSTPGFDPNSFVHGISHAEYKALSGSLDLPLYNRAAMGQYPPGSTVKPILGLAGLEYDVVTSNTSIDDPGWYRLPNDRRNYRDWKRWGHGKNIDLHTAIEQSCDIYFYDLAHKMGVDRIYAFSEQFGLGRASGIDLPVERHGLLPSRQWKRNHRSEPWYPGETLSVGIGQGYMLATPLQLAVATAVIASRGTVFSPRILKSVSGELPEASSADRMELRRPEHWDIIWQAMEAVVHGERGTAKGISRELSYRIAGKTGTAQVIGIAQGERYNASEIDERQRDHALFIAFAPVEDPSIAVAVVVENGEHGSSTAAPIARKLMDAYLLGEGSVDELGGTVVAR